MLRSHPRVHLFVLNLDEDHERLERFTDTMATVGVAFERWAATPGRDLDVRLFGSRPLGRGVFVTRFRGWSANEAACGVSHIRLLQHVVRYRLPWTVVMEDDGILDRELPLEIGSWDLPADADIVLLNDRASSGPMRSVGSTFSYADVAGGAGTEAYLISLEGARKLLRILYPFRDPLDFQMYSHFESVQRLDRAPFHWRLPRNPFASRIDLRAYRVVPSLVRHAGLGSSIGNQRHPLAHLYCRLLLGMEFDDDPRDQVACGRWMSCGVWGGDRDGSSAPLSCGSWIGTRREHRLPAAAATTADVADRRFATAGV